MVLSCIVFFFGVTELIPRSQKGGEF